MLYALIARAPTELTVLHDRNPLFVKLSDGTYRNGYELKILNKTHSDKTFKLEVEGLDSYVLNVRAAGEISAETLFVPADSVGHYHIFLESAVQSGEPKDITFQLHDKDSDLSDDYESVFITQRKR